MKVSALIFLCIVGVSVAVAIPVQPEYGAETQLTLADLENEQQNELNNLEGFTDDGNNVAREKRFILLKKKLALAKLAHFGLGALGLAGAAIATKGVVKHFISPTSFAYRASPRISVSYPSGAYYHSQYYR